MSNPSRPVVLVTGASGHLGSRVVQLLKSAGTVNVIAGTRHPEKLKDAGVETRRLDFDDPDSLATAFAGVERMLLISTDAMDGTDRRQRQHRAAIAAAEKSGVKHIAYTSWLNVDRSSAVVAPDHKATEQAIAATRMGHTFLRNSLYADLLLMSTPAAVASGKLYSAIGDGAVSYVAREDCARAAAAALADGFEGRRALDITGPAAVTQHELARLLGDVTGRPVTYVPLTREQMVSGMEGAGMPAAMAGAFVTFDIAGLRGELSTVGTAFKDLTGNVPTAMRDFLAQHRAVLLSAVK